MGQFKQALQGVPSDPAGASRWIQDHTTGWKCPECQADLCILGKHPLPLDQRCDNCKGLKPFGVGAWKGEASPVRREEYLAAAGVPAIFRSQPFEERNFRAVREALAWNGSSWALGLIGAGKTGKTTLAVEILWQLRDRARGSGFFVRVDRLVSGLMGAAGEDEKVRLYAAAMEARVAVFDDLGWGASGRSFERVFEVMAHRHGEGLLTVWTSNLQLGDIQGEKESGAPMVRRFQEGMVLRFSAGHEWQADPGGNAPAP